MQKLVGAKTFFSLEEHLFENGAFHGEKWAFPVWVQPNPQTLAWGGQAMGVRGEESGCFPLCPACRVLPPARALTSAPKPAAVIAGRPPDWPPQNW